MRGNGINARASTASKTEPGGRGAGELVDPVDYHRMTDRCLELHSPSAQVMFVLDLTT